MVAEPVPLDVSTMPELAALAEEVRRTGTPRVLRRDGEDVALLLPPRGRRGRRTKPAGMTEAQREAFLGAFGGWKDLVDGEELKRQLKAARGSSRPPVVL